MYYLEVKMWYSSGKTSCINIEQDEEASQRAYCQGGKRAGWLRDYEIKTVKEEW